MAGFRPYSEIIGNGRILKFFLANLFSIKKEAYTKIFRLVGVCVGEFFTKNTLKLYIGQSSLKNDLYSFKVFLVKKLAYANTYEPQNFCVGLFFDAEQVCKKKISKFDHFQ